MAYAFRTITHWFTSFVEHDGETRLFRIALLAVFMACSISMLAAQGRDEQAIPVFLPTQVRAVSTVPANGDVNPYGVAFVPQNWNGPAHSLLYPGDILVSNFNDSKNLQGTGTTIVRIPANGPPALFFQGKQPLGLSTALTITTTGYVFAGNFPSSDGTCQHAQNGSILVLNASGREIAKVSDGEFIQGPWDSAMYEEGNAVTLFVTNGLTGTVSRLDFKVSGSGVSLEHSTIIASGYRHQCDAVTFVDAPTGLVYEPKRDVLYIASTLDNKVFAIGNALHVESDNGRGQVIYEDAKHLHGPLGMAAAPNGDLLVSNNDVVNSDPTQPSEIVEFSVEGEFVKQISVDPAQGGSFGLNVSTYRTYREISHLAAVDDNTSLLLIWYVLR